MLRSGFWPDFVRFVRQQTVPFEGHVAQNVSIEECPAELNKSSVTIACTDFALLQLRETAIREIENIYSLRDAPTVRRFIRSHSEVIAVLIEAQPRLLQHFGPNVKVALEVVTDPEGDETDQ
jgi:hypothetical protein